MSVREKMREDFILLAADASAEEVLDKVQGGLNKYAVVELAPGQYAVADAYVLWKQVSAAPEQTLRDLDLPPCQPVDADADLRSDGWNAVERSPRRRTVVLEQGRPVGIFATQLSEEMSEDFVVLKAADPVEKAVEVLRSREIGYVVIALATGEYAVLLADELRQALDEATDMVGPAILQYRLSEVPGLALRPCQPVDIDQSHSAARRRRDRSPGKRTVVLEQGQPVGVFTKEERLFKAEMAAPSRLYGKRYGLFDEEAPAPAEPRSCPLCGAQIEFYELKVVDGQPRYLCPACGRAVE